MTTPRSDVLRERGIHKLWGFATAVQYACLARTRHPDEDSEYPAARPRPLDHPSATSDLHCARTRKVARRRHRITLADVQRARAALGIDARGLDPRQRKALEVLRSRNGRPLGVARLAARIDVTTRIWRTLLEPALLRLGLITTTPRGVAHVR